MFRGGHVDIKNPSGRLRGLSALHNTASDGPLIEKDQATAKPNARRMEYDCEGASGMMVTLARGGCCELIGSQISSKIGLFAVYGPYTTYMRTRTDPGGTGGDRGPKLRSLGRILGPSVVFVLRGGGARRGRHVRSFLNAVSAARPFGRCTVRALMQHLRSRAGPGSTGGVP